MIIMMIAIITIYVWRELRGSQGMGVVSNDWFDCVFTLNSSRAQTPVLTDVQIPFLGTP